MADRRVAVVASVVALIISIAIQEWGLSAATGIGTAVTGTAIGFVITERKTHQDRIDEWVKAITDNGC